MTKIIGAQVASCERCCAKEFDKEEVKLNNEVPQIKSETPRLKDVSWLVFIIRLKRIYIYIYTY